MMLCQNLIKGFKYCTGTLEMEQQLILSVILPFSSWQNIQLYAEVDKRYE